MTAGLIYDAEFMTPEEREELRDWLGSIQPIWEQRHPRARPLRDGQKTRRLLRPVYWLGGWQFACLNYYRGVAGHVVAAEPPPPVLAAMIKRIEAQVRATYLPADVPEGWTLNTCLINFYGRELREGRWVDTARVGAHKDHEPGPVASLSLGAKARFQFADRLKVADQDAVHSQWLENGSLMVFGTERWKRTCYHKVTIVQAGEPMDIAVEDFRVRRVNFTLRFVPPAHICAYGELSAEQRLEVGPAMEMLAPHSEFFVRALEGVGDRDV